MPSLSEVGDVMRQQHQELMCWHLARTNTDKRNSCSQSVGASSSSCFLLFSVLFSLLQMWLREPLPWQSTQRNLLLWVILHWTATCQERQLIFTEPHAQTPLLDYSWIFFFFSSLPAYPSRSFSPLLRYHSSAHGRWSILALWHRGHLFGDRVTCRQNVKRIRRSEWSS